VNFKISLLLVESSSKLNITLDNIRNVLIISKHKNLDIPILPFDNKSKTIDKAEVQYFRPNNNFISNTNNNFNRDVGSEIYDLEDEYFDRTSRSFIQVNESTLIVEDKITNNNIISTSNGEYTRCQQTELNPQIPGQEFIEEDLSDKMRNMRQECVLPYDQKISEDLDICLI